MRYLYLFVWLSVFAFVPVSAEARSLCRPDPAAIAQRNACAGNTRVSLAVVGDVLLHRPLAWRGYARGFETLWGNTMPWFRAADIAIANLEGPTAPGIARDGRRLPDPGPVFDDVVYTEYPRFNYHPVLIDALRDAGIDMVTTANNHALDRGPTGLAATMDELEARGMAFAGTIRAGARRDFARRLPTALGEIAFIACSYGTNGIPDPHGQVLLCHDQRAELLAAVRAEAARSALVVVLPHWGVEYSHRPTRAQRDLARDLVAAGAMAVIGTHPHVAQPVEWLQGPAGQALVAYSTGNFLAGQAELARASGLMIWAEACADPRRAGRATIAGAGYLPTHLDLSGPDPVLVMPGPDAAGTAAQGRALLARVAGGEHDLSAAAQCRSARRVSSGASSGPAMPPTITP
ncbi:MAG: CapA family protein [Pararhodobacter sp.]|nr:CapA family protein [Pararhodobacter sp.]